MLLRLGLVLGVLSLGWGETSVSVLGESLRSSPVSAREPMFRDVTSEVEHPAQRSRSEQTAQTELDRVGIDAEQAESPQMRDHLPSMGEDSRSDRSLAEQSIDRDFDRVMGQVLDRFAQPDQDPFQESLADD